MRILALVCLLVLAVTAAWTAPDDAPALDTQGHWRVKLGYADLGDWDDSAAIAVEGAGPNWSVTFGYAKADGTLQDPHASVMYGFDGDYWFAEASYLYRPQADQLLYIGIGPGYYDVDGDMWTLGAAVPVKVSGHDGSFGGHVQVGFESTDRKWFGEIQWVFETEHWDWDTDGIRVFLGRRF